MSLSILPLELLGLIGNDDVRILNPLSKLSRQLRRRVLPFLRDVPITKREMSMFIETKPLIVGTIFRESHGLYMNLRVSWLHSIIRVSTNEYREYHRYFCDEIDVLNQFRMTIFPDLCILDLHSQYNIYNKRSHRSREKILTSFDERVSEYRQKKQDTLTSKHMTVTQMVSYLTIQMKCLQLPVTLDQRFFEYYRDPNETNTGTSYVISYQEAKEQFTIWESQIESGIQEVRRELERLQ